MRGRGVPSPLDKRCLVRTLLQDMRYGLRMLLKSPGICSVAARASIAAVCLAIGLLSAPGLSAQSATAGWEKAAGGKMAFSVASVKPDTADMNPETVHANVPMGNGDYYNPTGGLFRTTDFSLSTYISFAYKLSSNDFKALSDQLPKWALSARYDIEARADGNPTKDQMRLMMQSLLADRFKLAVHWETKQIPVYAMVLDKPGKTGPQLMAHPKDAPCTTVYGEGPVGSASPDTLANGLPASCGGIQMLQPTVKDRIRYGARNVTLGLLANSLSGDAGLDRPMVDETGLSGTFDFTIEFPAEGVEGPNPQPDQSGPTFVQALKDQLGLKLIEKNATVDVIVVDHIEEPTPN
jgi:uncharacterized protein (TIGR03435 family)